MSGFFDFHVFGPGFNQFSVDSFRIVPIGDEFDVEVFVKQRLKGTTVYAQNCRVELTFMDNDRQMETRRISFPGPHGSATFRLPFAPAIVMTDLFERAGMQPPTAIKRSTPPGFTITLILFSSLMLPRSPILLL
ncbi:MAG: hypothetical protein IPH20_15460 [Bacteroidales bacterium]|nr:hypothetical protein [Bacteroidales bacterium]